MQGIIKLLGEENEKRLKDAITDLLIAKVESDLDEKYAYDYILAFDEIFEEVANEVKVDAKEKMIKILSEKLDGKISEVLGGDTK